MNNGPLSPKRVVTLFPNASGDSTQWTPDQGANYSRVNENPSTDNSSYVETAAAGNLDLYNYDDLTSSIVSGIAGVQINTDVRSTGMAGSVRQPAKLSTAQSDGPSVAVPDASYKTKTRLMETDPTGAAWTKDGVNNAQFGVKLG